MTLFGVLIVGGVLLVRKDRRPPWPVVVALIFAGACSAFQLVWWVHHLRTAVLLDVNPADKATILAAGISEAVNCAALSVIVDGGLAIAALIPVVLYLRFRRPPKPA